MGFYTVGKRGTIVNPRFNARGACKRLYEGMKGFGTNEDAIIEVIGGHTVAQRQEIKTKYKVMYGKDLIKELDGELSGAFNKIVQALMKDPEEYILECIRNSIVKSRGDKLLKKMKKAYMKGLLCPDAYTLLGLICLRTNEHLIEMKEAYKQKYDTELENDVGQDFPDEFCSIIFGIICATRDESPDLDFELVHEDIESLQEPPEGTKEEHFQSCFEERSWMHLRKLFNSYNDVTGEPMETMIEKSEVYSDIMKEAYTAVIKIIRCESDFYAERLNESLEGLGTDNDALNRFIVLRSEIDLADIILRYDVLFGKSLEDDVIGDTSGDYKNILLKLLTLPEDEEEEEDEEDTGVAYTDKVVKKKVQVVEIMTQTDLVDHKEEDVEMPKVNAADENVQEVEEKIIQEKVEQVKESAPEEDETEEGTEEEVVAVEEEVIPAEQKEEVIPAEQKEEAEVAEQQEEVEVTNEGEGQPNGKEEEDEVVPTIEQVDEENKKNDDVDNADGG